MTERRTVLVTGAAGSIGSAVALCLAQEGARVVVADIDAEGLATTVEQVDRIGGEGVAQILDVTDVEAVDQVVGEAWDRYSGLQGLVNNAGASIGPGILATTVEQYDRCFDLNAKGQFFVLQSCARRMAERGSGRIVNVGSIAAKGFIKKAHNVAYSSAKGAVLSLTRATAIELGPYGVNVNAVCPGPTLTPAFQKAMDAEGQASMFARMSVDRMPLGHPADPVDVANVIAFLLSDGARMITGQCINIDGGLLFD